MSELVDVVFGDPKRGRRNLDGLVDAAIATRDRLMEAVWVKREPAVYSEQDCLVTARCKVLDKLAVEEDLRNFGTVKHGFYSEKWMRISSELSFLMESEARDRGFRSAVSYNDHPDRTFNEIMDFMDSVIRRAKEEESA